MLHELEHILHTLNTIDAHTEKNIFDEDEIQKELKEIDDFPELLHEISYNIELLRYQNFNNISDILKVVLEIDEKLFSCTSNIELVRDKVGKARAYYAQRKKRKSENVNTCTTRADTTVSNKYIIIYELREMIRELTRIDAELQRGAYTEKYVQEAYEDLREFSQLLNTIQQYTSAIENTDVDDITTMLGLLADLEANLTSCANIIAAKNEFIRQFLLQISNDEIIE